MAARHSSSNLFPHVALLVAIASAVGCLGTDDEKRPNPPPFRNVLLISMDTTRADYLSCYGYAEKTTPNIYGLAAEGILFENVVTPVPLTLPSHSTMFTGTNPQQAEAIRRRLELYKEGQPYRQPARDVKETGA